MYRTPTARIILDSLHPNGTDRLTTMEVKLHRFVLAEFNTHRVFSRNSASSRAIPLAKQIETVLTNPAFPICWPKEQKGMQGGEELSEAWQDEAEYTWHQARDAAVDLARVLGQQIGVHKSVASRLLEPFMWQTIIVTSTEWTNFFQLRCSPMAQPEIRAAAEAMQAALTASTPIPLAYGEWHLPFVTGYDADRLGAADPADVLPADTPLDFGPTDLAKLCSAARCARVSYLTHDTGTRDVGRDLDLALRLINPGDGAFHASPFEHVATPVTASYTVLGNFTNFKQFRHELESDLENS